MIEAKMKDLALFKLVEDIKLLRTNYKWIDETSFEV
jgi:UV DNA damage endonuclease